jgi:hypothetical protein
VCSANNKFIGRNAAMVILERSCGFVDGRGEGRVLQATFSATDGWFSSSGSGCGQALGGGVGQLAGTGCCPAPLAPGMPPPFLGSLFSTVAASAKSGW